MQRVLLVRTERVPDGFDLLRVFGKSLSVDQIADFLLLLSRRALVALQEGLAVVTRKVASEPGLRAVHTLLPLRCCDFDLHLSHSFLLFLINNA